MSLQSVASVAAPPAPVLRADMRPTADTAALIRDPQPEIPLPIPASTSQKSTVTQAQLTSPPVDVSAVQRVLKPYGVVMLPQGKAQQPGTLTVNSDDSDRADAADATTPRDAAADTGAKIAAKEDNALRASTADDADQVPEDEAQDS